MGRREYDDDRQRRGNAGPRDRASQDTGGNDVGGPSTGVIKRMQKDKGFGFIREDGTNADIFFHRASGAHSSK